MALPCRTPAPGPFSAVDRRPRLAAALLAVLVGLMLLPAQGCSCRAETEPERVARLAREEAERLEREKKRLEEEQRRLPVQLPPARISPAGEAAVSLFVKPGHWNAVTQPAKANAEDFDGRISYEIVRGSNEPIPIAGASTRLRSERPLVVARESLKTVESLFFCPPSPKTAPRLRAIVRDRRSGALVSDFATPLRPLLDHQHHFVVLSDQPGRYAFLDSLYSFTAPVGSSIDVASIASQNNALPATKNYRLVAPPLDAPSQEVALPDDALAWTSIAYLLWDGADPKQLRPAQRDALVDWLNWGGQLIVNGPGSLDLLRGSFLDPLLPAQSDGAREISPAEIDAMADSWRVTTKRTTLSAGGAWQGVRLNPHGEANALPGLDGLLVERRVGRGRIVVSAFSLREPRLLDWREGVENFFNAAVLRRPPRRFVAARGFSASDGNEVLVRWEEPKTPVRFHSFDNTKHRSFVRDTHADASRLALEVAAEGAGGDFQVVKPAPVAGGAGATRHFNVTANAARDALRESAGVSIPGSGFVVACLAIYLVALVPVNWLLFYALGRVELAWAAAPLIALAGAWVVIQQARLDIGFVRSRTEIAVLETQPDTPRGLLTRFTALYTSLSTTYGLEFEATAVAGPFPAGSPSDGPTSAYAAIVFERQEKSRLKNVAVSSASAELLRSDELFDVAAAGVPGSSVPGGVSIGRGPAGQRLSNRTAWTLDEAIVVRRSAGFVSAAGDARLEGCWVGEVPPGDVADVAFLPIDTRFVVDGGLPFAAERVEVERLRRERDEARLRLDELTRLALDPNRFEPGETRVVARIDQILPGVTIEPGASQQRGATLLVAHLGYGLLPPPTSDANAPLDVASARRNARP